MSLPKIIVIVGPTASGKTWLGVELAKIYGGEVISADSMQIYKGMDIKTPIVTGGTGLYIDALINDFQFENSSCEKNIDILSSVAGEVTEENNQNLYEILKKLDPLSAKYINQNDIKRINHAINFFNKFGFSIYNQKINTEKNKFKYNKEFEIIKLGLNFKNRDILYDRINKRVDLMLQNGLLEEINRVRKLRVSKTASAAIGYKELLPYFNGETTLYQAIEKIKQQTRRYAKRQITWFKRCPITKWIFKD